ncbi:MAG: ketol-acid reductoisomerase, partial [Planctomycetes bacterium DG_23]
MAKIYYEDKCDIEILKGKTIAIIGYGSQGHAQAQNLRDSGLEVSVAEIEGTENYKLAQKHGFTPLSAAEASKRADLVQMLVPDEVQAWVYKEEIAPNLVAGNVLGFSHGFNIHYGQIKPAENLDVIMVAPKGPGHLVRSEFEKGG